MRLSPALPCPCLAAVLPAAARWPASIPIGKPVKQAGMEVGAVYLQPIEMDPPGMMRAAAESDMHLEPDIKAIAGNKNGFPDGEWIPALDVHYDWSRSTASETSVRRNDDDGRQ